MAIPTYEEAMIPVLKHANQGGEYRQADFTDSVSEYFSLDDEERSRLLGSGSKRVIVDRTSWAIVYLHRAGLLERVRRGFYSITDEGRRVLNADPDRLDSQYLYDNFPEFADWRDQSNQPKENSDSESKGFTNQTAHDQSELSQETPNEDLERAALRLRKLLVSEIVDQLATVSPEKFEQIVLDTVVAMGYGGTHKDAAQRVGRSGDEGIDGIINEDRLGLDTIYLQAKRWQNVVGRPEIQKFVGALQGMQASKGVFITTSDFTTEARDYAKRVGTRVVLIDGSTLADYMIEFGVGVTTERTVLVKRIDSDYFEDGV